MKLFGEDFWISLPSRRSTADYDTPMGILYWSDTSIVLDAQRMPSKLVQLMPLPLCKVLNDPKLWEPFVRLALGMRLLQ